MGKKRVLRGLLERVFRKDLNKNADSIDAKVISANTGIDNLTTSGGSSNDAEVIDARGVYPSLGDRLDNVDSVLAENAANLELFKKRTGEVDDTERLQRVIDYCASKKQPLKLNGGQFTVRALTIPSGMKLYGEGAVFIKPKLNTAPYNMTVEQMKWVRMMSISYSGTTDSEITIIEGITLDGNCWKMWDTPSYDQEQASLLFCMADSQKKGRLKVLINNCHFRNNVSDGIHLFTNVDGEITSCSSYDCFRGGLIVTGGNSLVNVNGFRFISDRLSDGIDVEVDSVGYGDSERVMLNFNNIIIDNDLDISLPTNSECNLTNVIMTRPGFYSIFAFGNAVFNIINAKLQTNKPGYPDACFLNRGGLIRVMNSDFVLDDVNNTGSTACSLYFYDNNDKQAYTFENCRFSVINRQASKEYSGVKRTNSDGNFCRVEFSKCHFTDTIGFGIDMPASRIEVTKTRFSTSKYAYRGGSTNYCNVNLVMDGIVIDNSTCRELYLFDHKTTVEHYNTTLYSLENARIDGPYSYDYRDGTWYTSYIGNRTIYAGVDPTLVKFVCGIVDDVFIADRTLVLGGVKHKKFKCTKMSDGTKSVWVATG